MCLFSYICRLVTIISFGMQLEIRFVFISHSQVFPGEKSLSDAKFCKVLQ